MEWIKWKEKEPATEEEYPFLLCIQGEVLLIPDCFSCSYTREHYDLKDAYWMPIELPEPEILPCPEGHRARAIAESEPCGYYWKVKCDGYDCWQGGHRNKKLESIRAWNAVMEELR